MILLSGNVQANKSRTTPLGTTARLPPPAPPKIRDGAPQGDTATIANKTAPLPELSDLVAKARAAAAGAPTPQAPATAKGSPETEEASLVIPGVPLGKDLPVTVKAQITVKGTAQVLEMNDDEMKIHIAVKGKVLFVNVERDYTIGIKRQPDGSYLYRTKDNKSGEISEGKATDMVIDGNVKRFKVESKDAKTPATMTDMGNGRFLVKGDGFEADINKI